MSGENHGKTMGKPWENHGENGGFTKKHGDFMGFIADFWRSWWN
jgi:hypothetical protein